MSIPRTPYSYLLYPLSAILRTGCIVRRRECRVHPVINQCSYRAELDIFAAPRTSFGANHTGLHDGLTLVRHCLIFFSDGYSFRLNGDIRTAIWPRRSWGFGSDISSIWYDQETGIDVPHMDMEWMCSCMRY